MFKERIAHGILSASYISAVFGMELPGPGAIYISQTLNFKGPVKIGDTVTAKVKVIELIAGKRRARFETQCSVAGKPVVEGEAVLMVPAAYSASRWTGFLSPEISAKPLISASLTVLVKVASWPSCRSSKYVVLSVMEAVFRWRCRGTPCRSRPEETRDTRRPGIALQHSLCRKFMQHGREFRVRVPFAVA
jgi:hypothetical protein